MYSTSGVVIQKKDKGENDQLITFFTKDYGKIVLIAKGIRKSTSKLSGHVGLFSFSEIGFVLGKAYKVLTSAIELGGFLPNKEDLDKLKAADHISKLILKHSFSEEKDDRIFELISNSFSYLSEKDFSDLELEYFLRYFEFKFLTILGYKPHEKEVESFFASQKVSRKAIEDIKMIFLRYFKNIFNEL